MTLGNPFKTALWLSLALPVCGGCDPDNDGLRGGSEDDRIIGGSEAPQEVFDYVGAIYKGTGFHCSMVAVHPRWVLTAGHCFYDENNGWAQDGSPSDYKGVIGRTDLADSADGVEVTFDSFHLLHPTDRSFTTTYDLALAHVTSVIPSDHIVELAPVESAVGDSIRLVGYGQTENGTLPNRLRYRYTTRTEECPEHQFCTGVGVNHGDSGGAALDGDGRLVGINSAKLTNGSKLARSVLYRTWIDSIVPKRHESQYILTADAIRYRQGLTGAFSDYPSQYTPGNGEMQAITRFVAYQGGEEIVFEYVFRGGDVWLRESPASSWSAGTVAPAGHGWHNAASISDIAGCSSGLLQYFNTRLDRTRGEVTQGFGCDGQWYYRIASIEDYVHPWEASWNGLGSEAEWLSYNGAGGLGSLRSELANDAKMVAGTWTYSGPDLDDLTAPLEYQYQSVWFDKSKDGEPIGWYRNVNGESWEASWIGPFTTGEIGPNVSEVVGGAVLNLR